jgi:hypothetical protein
MLMKQTDTITILHVADPNSRRAYTFYEALPEVSDKDPDTHPRVA